jgi:tripartite ATP-independent transporter DctM subunit
LFAGGLFVGVLLGLSFLTVAVWISWRKGYGVREPFTWRKVAVTGKAAVWSMGAPVVVLGGILSGIVTVTEAAALAVFYALLVGSVINRELAWKDLPGLIIRSQVAAGGILFIIAMAKIFGWLLAMQQGAQLLDTFVNSLSLPPVGLLLLVMGMLLVVGCVMETTAALLLLVPVLALLTPQMQVDPVQFGVLVVVNLAIGMLTPPVGICLFVSCGIAGVSLGKISRAVMPLVIVALLDLLIAALWAPITMWLPSLLYR